MSKNAPNPAYRWSIAEKNHILEWLEGPGNYEDYSSKGNKGQISANISNQLRLKGFDRSQQQVYTKIHIYEKQYRKAKIFLTTSPESAPFAGQDLDRKMENPMLRSRVLQLCDEWDRIHPVFSSIPIPHLMVAENVKDEDDGEGGDSDSSNQQHSGRYPPARSQRSTRLTSPIKPMTRRTSEIEQARNRAYPPPRSASAAVVGGRHSTRSQEASASAPRYQEISEEEDDEDEENDDDDDYMGDHGRGDPNNAAGGRRDNKDSHMDDRKRPRGQEDDSDPSKRTKQGSQHHGHHDSLQNHQQPSSSLLVDDTDPQFVLNLTQASRSLLKEWQIKEAEVVKKLMDFEANLAHDLEQWRIRNRDNRERFTERMKKERREFIEEAQSDYDYRGNNGNNNNGKRRTAPPSPPAYYNPGIKETPEERRTRVEEEERRHDREMQLMNRQEELDRQQREHSDKLKAEDRRHEILRMVLQLKEKGINVNMEDFV